MTDRKTWIAWRMKLGAGRKEAGKLWLAYQEWLAEEALQPRVRRLQVAPWQNWEREFRAWLDEMPRKPLKFLAMVAAAEKRRTMKSAAEARKAIARRKYQRQYERRADS